MAAARLEEGLDFSSQACLTFSFLLSFVPQGVGQTLAEQKSSGVCPAKVRVRRGRATFSFAAAARRPPLPGHQPEL
jgi:hypothetical protein